MESNRCQIFYNTKWSQFESKPKMMQKCVIKYIIFYLQQKLASNKHEVSTVVTKILTYLLMYIIYSRLFT